VARSLRVEYEGARYHVLNRGNYRRPLFEVHRTGETFLEALYEASERYGWILHGYVVMSNHYHLAVETPLANLSSGMQYLQSVFSNRFNKFVGERGHVFQGRYKALLLEDTTALLQVVDYIHLNPVRAGVIAVEELKSYRLSSFPDFFCKKGRPAFLRPVDFLHEAGGLTDSAVGMRAYHRRLKWITEEDPREREEEYERLCRGWYVGTEAGKAHLAGKVQNGEAKANAAVKGELEEMRWVRLLKAGLDVLGKNEMQLVKDKRSAEWKLALATWLKSQTGASNRWLGENLLMGHLQSVSKNVGVYRAKRMKSCPYAQTLSSHN
jgi:putative transposase